MRFPWFALVLAACSGQAAVGSDTTGSGGTGPGGTDPGGTDPGGGGGGGGGGGECSWLATYDLTGSHLYIESTVDFTITVQEPYSDDLNTGPGEIVLRYPDVDGAMGPGELAWIEYRLVWDFVTGAAGLASVHTDLDNNAGPEDAGMASGTLTGGKVEWSPSEITVCQEGEITCTGAVCGSFGSPPAGEPEQVSGCAPWTIHPFTISDDLQTLDMAPAIVTDEDGTTTAMEFHGTLVDAVQDGGC